MGGPYWIAPIHDRKFVRKILANLELVEEHDKKFGTLDRMIGMLTVVEEELEDCPFFYSKDRLSSIAKIHSAKMTLFRSALLNAGYAVSLSHACKMAIKSNAPNDFIWDMIKAWEKLNPVRREKFAADSIPLKILNQPMYTDKDVSFELHPASNPASRAAGLKRFQMNPAPNWGPKMKAHTKQKEIEEKREQNQGKHKGNKRSITETPNAVLQDVPSKRHE